MSNHVILVCSNRGISNPLGPSQHSLEKEYVFGPACICENPFRPPVPKLHFHETPAKKVRPRSNRMLGAKSFTPVSMWRRRRATRVPLAFPSASRWPSWGSRCQACHVRVRRRSSKRSSSQKQGDCVFSLFLGVYRHVCLNVFTYPIRPDV